MRSLALALVVCLAAVPLRAAAASPDPVAHAKLTVDTSEIGDAGPILRTRLLERGGQVLRDGRVLPAEGAGGLAVVVRVQELRGEDPGFAFEIAIINAERASSGERWSVQCALCTETELVDSVAVELAKVASTLTALAAADSEADPAPDQGTNPGTEPGPDPRPDPRPDPVPEAAPAVHDGKHLHRLTRAGIGVAAGGLLAAGAGLGLVLAKPRPLPDDPLHERYTQPPGYALLAVGGAALVAATVLFIVGARKARTSRSVAFVAGGLRFGRPPRNL